MTMNHVPSCNPRQLYHNLWYHNLCQNKWSVHYPLITAPLNNTFWKLHKMYIYHLPYFSLFVPVNYFYQHQKWHSTPLDTLVVN